MDYLDPVRAPIHLSIMELSQQYLALPPFCFYLGDLKNLVLFSKSQFSHL